VPGAGTVGGGPAPADAGGPEPDPGAAMVGVAPAGLTAAVVDSPNVPGAYLLHDCKIRRRVSEGRLRVEALPPEQFLISRNVVRLDEDAPFCAHAYQETRSEL